MDGNKMERRRVVQERKVYTVRGEEEESRKIAHSEIGIRNGKM